MVWRLSSALATAVTWTSAAAGSAGRRPLVWGLDLGNDNIVMAVASRTGVDVVTNEVSGRQTPTAVFFAGDHRLIGEHTTGHAGGDPRNLVHHLKSLLYGEDASSSSAGSSPAAAGTAGSRRDSSTTAAVEPDFFCETRRRGDGDDGNGDRAALRAVVRHMGQELELGASELISYLLQHCAGVVARETAAGRGEAAAQTTASSSPLPSSSCMVASVPSYFSLRQKRAVLDAASIAGVTMPMVMDEGTAVALAYGILKGGLPSAGSSARPPLKVAFVDIGHSCTQVTVASFTASGLRVLGRGCSRGGGTAAAEACVYDRVCRAASEQGIAVKGRPRAEFRLGKAVTSAMKTLSANKEARLSVDCIDGDKDLAIMLTRKELEEACGAVAIGVSTACQEALSSAGMTAKDVQDVELLGGGSYIPLLRRAVEGTFGVRGRVRRTMSSSESVARGCALAAAQHSSVFKLRPFDVVDSLTKDIRLVWRYDGSGGDHSLDSDNGSASGDSFSRTSLLGNREGAAGREEGGMEGVATGEVDVPAGTPIPWSTAVSVDLRQRGTRENAGRERGKLYVHIMEGADRVASYLIDLGQPARGPGMFGGKRAGGGGVLWGWGATATGAAAGAAAATKLGVVFRVDDGGMPSVQSASLEYEEEVTEFVEMPAPAPTATPAAAAAAAAESSSSPTGGDNSGGRGDGDGSSGDENSSEATATKMSPQKLSEAVEGMTEQAERAEKKEEGSGAERKEDSGSRGSGRRETATARVVAKGGSKDGGAETPGAPEGSGAKEGWKEEEGDGGGGRVENERQGGGEKSPGKLPAAKKIKVRRVVTRRRSRPVRLQQTYSGMLEGPALEEARERERALRAQDEAVRSANEACNALETLLYASRSSLEPVDGDLSPFISPSDAAAVLRFFEETEEWLYAPDEGGAVPRKEAFERRASSLQQRLSEPRARREARVAFCTALDEAEAAVATGEARLEEARDSLSDSQRRDVENELESVRRFVAESRRKLEVSGDQKGSGEYGSLLGRLPAQEGDVRKRTDRLHKVLAFTRREHS